MALVTWRELISFALEIHNESWDDVEAVSVDDCELDIAFDDGFGSAEGVPFVLWTPQRVYFAVEYDGSEGVDSVPRHPGSDIERHI